MFESEPPPEPITKPTDSPDWNGVGGLHESEGDTDQALNTPPTFSEKVKHAGQAAARVARAVKNGDKVRLPKRERKRRRSICKQCEFWKPRGNFFLGECQHAQCGCTRLKHGLATEVCPAGKW